MPCKRGLLSGTELDAMGTSYRELNQAVFTRKSNRNMKTVKPYRIKADQDRLIGRLSEEIGRFRDSFTLHLFLPLGLNRIF